MCLVVQELVITEAILQQCHGCLTVCMCQDFVSFVCDNTNKIYQVPTHSTAAVQLFPQIYHKALCANAAADQLGLVSEQPYRHSARIVEQSCTGQ